MPLEHYLNHNMTKLAQLNRAEVRGLLRQRKEREQLRAPSDMGSCLMHFHDVTK